MLYDPSGFQPQRVSPGEFVSLLLGYLSLLGRIYEARERGLPDHLAAPVKVIDLLRKGVLVHVILWMLFERHVVHLQPATNESGNGNSYQLSGSQVLTAVSSLSLTDLGEEFAGDMLSAALIAKTQSEFEEFWNKLVLGSLKPRYDRTQRIWSYGQYILKHFRQPANLQELVLCAAEELNWASWFDDPLPRVPGTNSKTRLHDTIKELNRRQHNHLVHFKGDGTGTRIGWEFR